MRRSFALLGVLTWYLAAPDTSPRKVETFGDWSTPVNVTELNTDSNDMYAVLTKDELTVYFSSNRDGGVGGDDLWYATRPSVVSPWGTPKNMGSINTGAMDSLPMLSYDEHVMFFYSTRTGGCGPTPTGDTGDIWMTRRRHARLQDWGTPRNLGCVLNTAATEIAPAFFENPETEEVTLFYGSNRSGVPPQFDVYASRVGEDGYFGPGALVPELSSPGRDTRIFVRKDGLEVFVTSDRAEGQGMIDIWTSTRATLSDQWSTPLVDLPSPVNSSCDDGSPWLSRDGTTLYFFSTRPGLPCGDRDIWYTTRMKIQQENSPPETLTGFWNRTFARLSGSH
jgi:WD40-like Beta Propeller Repeat